MLTSGAKGDSAFPQFGPLGGEINSIPVLVSDCLSSGQVVLVDASGVGAASGDIGLNEISEGTVVLDTVPDSPPSASTNYISLWQMNMRAVVSERFLSLFASAAMLAQRSRTAIATKVEIVRHDGNKRLYRMGRTKPQGRTCSDGELHWLDARRNRIIFATGSADW